MPRYPVEAGNPPVRPDPVTSREAGQFPTAYGCLNSIDASGQWRMSATLQCRRPDRGAGPGTTRAVLQAADRIAASRVRGLV